MGQYDGKRVVITGVTSGMALATAKLLLDQGARVLVTGSTKKTIDSARQELGKNAIVMSSDARVLTDIDALAAREVGARGGGLSAPQRRVRNVRARLRARPGRHMTRCSIWSRKGPYFAAQKLCSADASRKRDRTHDIHREREGDARGQRVTRPPKPGSAPLARSLAAEPAPRGYPRHRHQPLVPSTRRSSPATGLPKEQMDQMHKKMGEAVPMKRHGRPEEIAKAAFFLAFDATFTNGHELPVDGGTTQLCVR